MRVDNSRIPPPLLILCLLPHLNSTMYIVRVSTLQFKLQGYLHNMKWSLPENLTSLANVSTRCTFPDTTCSHSMTHHKDTYQWPTNALPPPSLSLSLPLSLSLSLSPLPLAITLHRLLWTWYPHQHFLIVTEHEVASDVPCGEVSLMFL